MKPFRVILNLDFMYCFDGVTQVKHTSKEARSENRPMRDVLRWFSEELQTSTGDTT